jgi:hypothetical protein
VDNEESTLFEILQKYFQANFEMKFSKNVFYVIIILFTCVILFIIIGCCGLFFYCGKKNSRTIEYPMTSSSPTNSVKTLRRTSISGSHISLASIKRERSQKRRNQLINHDTVNVFDSMSEDEQLNEGPYQNQNFVKGLILNEHCATLPHTLRTIDNRSIQRSKSNATLNFPHPPMAPPLPIRITPILKRRAITKYAKTPSPPPPPSPPAAPTQQFYSSDTLITAFAPLEEPLPKPPNLMTTFV